MTKTTDATEKPDYIAYLELGDGDRLEVKREAKGLDLYFAFKAQFKNLSFEASLIATTCTRNGSTLTIESASELEMEVSEALSEVLLKPAELITVDEREFPKKYALGDKEIALLRNRLVGDNAKAQSRSNNDQAALVFWLLSFLVRVDGKAPTYDDLLDMPAGEVQALMPLVMPKKNKFQLVKI